MRHYVGGREAGLELVAHEVHVGGHMGEEAPVALAEVVDRFVGGGACNAVFGAFAVAGEEPFAFAALFRQGQALGGSEAALLVGGHHFDKGFVAQVSEVVFRKHEVVAAVNVAVVFHNCGVATFLVERAHTRGHPAPVGQSRVEELDKDFANIFLDPEVEQTTEEFAPLFGAHRKVGEFA